MIIFLYGEDTYRINRKLLELVSGYKLKNSSGLNLTRLDFAEDAPEKFFEAVRAGSLIAEKKLVILKNIFSVNAEEILNFLKSQNLGQREDIILIIAVSGALAKNKLFEYLIRKPNKAQNFQPLKPYEVKTWAKQFADSFNINFSGEALDFLILNCNSDLWRLDSEIKKLANFAKGNVITKSQVEELLVSNINHKIFELTDALAGRNKKKAIEMLFDALNNGEKPTELLGLLAWQIRNLLRFKLNPEKPAALKLHSFVLEKTRRAAKFFSLDELRAILSKIINLDLAFKTSALNEETALSLLIAEI